MKTLEKDLINLGSRPQTQQPTKEERKEPTARTISVAEIERRAAERAYREGQQYYTPRNSLDHDDPWSAPNQTVEQYLGYESEVADD